MTFTTLPRSHGTSAAARRMQQAGEAHARAAKLAPPRIVPPGGRAISALKLPATVVPNTIRTAMPVVRIASPNELIVETSYQRDLSDKSLRLIRRIVSNWDWAKFKPPICAASGGNLFVIDGQHAAIAAATHPGVKKIPVLVVDAPAVERRADAFVSHNRDRLKMSTLQVFHAELAAGDRTARAIVKIAAAEGATIPKYAPPAAYAKPGQLTAIVEFVRAYISDGADKFARLVRVLARTQIAPIPVILVRALRMIFTRADLAGLAAVSDERIVAAVRQINTGKLPLDIRARQHAYRIGLKRDRACALLIADAAGVAVTAEAA